MLPARRPFHATSYAAGILSAFPAWMTLQKPTSIGYKFVDAILGNELEFFNSALQIYQDYNSIVRSPIDAMTNIWQVELPYFLKSTSITDNTGTIPIQVVETPLEFLTNPPTRIGHPFYVLTPSGLNSNNIVGMEWLDGSPTGSLVLKVDGSEVVASSLLYYDILNRTNSINVIPSSGTNLAIGYVGLGQNSLFESGIIRAEWSLRGQYPIGKWLTTSGTVSNSKPSGIIWPTQNYIDLDTGNKVYYQMALNNPYGSGIYNQSDVQLSYFPISGTIIITDVFNLISGAPVVIPSSGINIYAYSSGALYNGVWQNDTWSYKGLENPVPWDVLPLDYQQAQIALGLSGVGPTASGIGKVSWRFLPSGGYIDDEVYPHSGTFKWIDGSGALSNVIRFSGGFSKYDIEYSYQQVDKITQLSADPKNQYHAASPDTGTLYFITGIDFWQNIDFETSATNSKCIRIDPYMLRPGSMLYYTFLMNTNYNDTWSNANTQDKTIQFYNHNIGYTDNLGIRNVL